MTVSTLEQVKLQLAQSLQLGNKVERFNEATPLLGSLPELDSMAVVSVITALEDHFGIVVADDEINAETFETVGSLVAFVDSKLAQN
jgi:acyl carrier protein